MNDAMWQSAVVQRNAATLGGLGFGFCGPVVGHLAEGYEAVGRLVEPDAILAAIERQLASGSQP
jgi:phosphopantothenoylcysteine synthetase/decarboxylase